ncbi:hypothetical protein AB6A40_004576 [Gnathostoma spinigerum]|uniref:Large ribosomal subunit protein eL6 n=1 Tax=Gnathostoma spinigerum TaxID=75299 RepID=A0ABD6EMC7_9BILA
MVGEKLPRAPRMPKNYELCPGLMRFSRARMYHRRGLWARKKFEKVKKPIQKKEKYITKPIGGDKNGGERKVLIHKGPRYLPIEPVRHKVRRKPKAVPLRKSLTPGTVLIMLAGVHKGKRVVFLKQLKTSGLLLVTGPMKLNCCPLRRVAQAFVIATKTKIDISNVEVPEHIDDTYFKRVNTKKSAKKEGDANIFAQGVKEDDFQEYVVSDQKKADQKVVDAAVIEAIKKHPDHKILTGYLSSRFSLEKHQYPHEMIF